MKSHNKCYKYPQRETNSLLSYCKANHRILLKLPFKNTKKSVTSLLRNQKWNRWALHPCGDLELRQQVLLLKPLWKRMKCLPRFLWKFRNSSVVSNIFMLGWNKKQELMSQHSVELLARLWIRFSSVFLTALCSLAMPSSCKAFSLVPKLDYSCLALLGWYRAARACLGLYRAFSTEFTWYAHTRECAQHLEKVCRWVRALMTWSNHSFITG